MAFLDASMRTYKVLRFSAPTIVDGVASENITILTIRGLFQQPTKSQLSSLPEGVADGKQAFVFVTQKRLNVACENIPGRADSNHKPDRIIRGDVTDDPSYSEAYEVVGAVNALETGGSFTSRFRGAGAANTNYKYMVVAIPKEEAGDFQEPVIDGD